MMKEVKAKGSRGGDLRMKRVKGLTKTEKNKIG